MEKMNFTQSATFISEYIRERKGVIISRITIPYGDQMQKFEKAVTIASNYFTLKNDEEGGNSDFTTFSHSFDEFSFEFGGHDFGATFSRKP